MANPNRHMLSLVQSHHVEKRTCHREGHHDGKDLKNEGQTKPMKVQELHLGSGGPQLGPRGPYLKAYLWGWA